MAHNRNESDSRRRIPKLEGSQDFPVCRIYLTERLANYDVLNVIKDPEPDPDSSATTINRWNKANKKARSEIVFNLGTEPIAVVTQLLTDRASAADVWKKLESSYQKENIQSKLNLRNKLHSMLFKEGQEPQDLFTTLERIFIDLARLKDPVMENDKVAILLRSLPNSYMHIASLSESKNMDYDTICAMIKSEHDRREHKNGHGHLKALTPAARMSKFGLGGSPKDKKNIECWGCGRRGHFRSECRKELAKRKRQGFSRANRPGNVSRNRGGTFRRNRNYRNDRHRNQQYNDQYQDRNLSRGFIPRSETRLDFNRNSASFGDEGTPAEHGSQAFQRPKGFLVRQRRFSSKTTKSQSTWMDGGANGNFVWDRNLFFDYHQVAGTEVDICEGRSKIVGIGKIRLPIGKGIIIEASHAPNFNDNIFCQAQLVKLFNIVLQSADDNTTGFEGALFFDKVSGELLHKSPLTNGMYPLPSPRRMVARSFYSARSTEKRSAKDWHEVLGHIGS